MKEQHRLEKQFRDDLPKYRKQLIKDEQKSRGYQPGKGRQFIILELKPIEDTILEVTWESRDVPHGYAISERKVAFTESGEMIIIESDKDYKELYAKYEDSQDETLIELKDKYKSIEKELELTKQHYEDVSQSGELSDEAHSKLYEDLKTLQLHEKHLQHAVDKIQHKVSHIQELLAEVQSGQSVDSRVKDPDELMSIYHDILSKEIPKLKDVKSKLAKSQKLIADKQHQLKDVQGRLADIMEEIEELHTQFIVMKFEVRDQIQVLVAKELLAKYK